MFKCKTCDVGYVLPKKKYRMSAPVVLIGWIILIPCLLGMVIGVSVMFGSPTAAASALEQARAEAKRELEAGRVPSSIVQRVLDHDVVTTAEKSLLEPGQRDAVESVTAKLSGSAIGAGAGGAIGGIAGFGVAVMSFVGGLLGWLLTMKKRVLQCNNCEAVIAAS